MQIRQYIDLEKIYEDCVISYTRVSTADQDIQKQKNYATAYINNHNIDEKKVIPLEDDDVSANKLKMEERPGLMELRLLIKEKKVKTIIAYSRDRLARNFYEYVALVKEFYHYGVNVIFTGDSQPPFSQNLSYQSRHFTVLSPRNARNEKRSFPKVCSTYEKPPLKSSMLAKC